MSRWQRHITLGVTQSSFGIRIKMLEDRLGIPLFKRRHRGVQLTKAGHRFVVDVAAGIEQLDHAVKTTRKLAQDDEGPPSCWPTPAGHRRLSRRFVRPIP